MKKKSSSRYFGIAVLMASVLVQQSCIKDFPDETKDNWNPTIANSIASGNLTMQELLLNSGNPNGLSEGTDKFLSFIYKSSSTTLPCNQWLIFADAQKQSQPALFDGSTFPDFNTRAMTDTTINDTLTLSINGVAQSQVDQLLFKEGTLTLDATSDFKDSVLVTIDIPGLILSGAQHVKSTLAVNYNGQTTPVHQTQDVSLNNVNASLLSSKIPYTIRIVRKKLNNALLSDKITVKASVTNISYKYITGKFNGINFPVLNGVMPIDVFQHFSPDQLQVDDPVVRVYTSNSCGIPLVMRFDTMAARVKGGQYLNINNNNPFYWSYKSPAIGQNVAVHDSLVYNKTNSSNLANIISKVPENITYRASSVVGTLKGYLSDTSRVKMDVIAEFPLNAAFSNLVLSDTLPVNVATISDVNKADHATLHLNAINAFPFDINMGIYFYDSKTGQVVDSLAGLSQNILKPGILLTGDKVSAVNTNADFPVNSSKLKAMVKADKIILKARVSSVGTQYVKFYSDYHLAYNLGILLNKVNLK